MITSERDLEIKISLATRLGFKDDVEYWTSELEKLKTEGSK